MESGQTTIFFTAPYGHHLAIYNIVTEHHLSENRPRRKSDLLGAVHECCRLKGAQKELAQQRSSVH